MEHVAKTVPAEAEIQIIDHVGEAVGPLLAFNVVPRVRYVSALYKTMITKSVRTGGLRS